VKNKRHLILNVTLRILVRTKQELSQICTRAPGACDTRATVHVPPELPDIPVPPHVYGNLQWCPGPANRLRLDTCRFTVDVLQPELILHSTAEYDQHTVNT
jgi:hypothetical protein